MRTKLNLKAVANQIAEASGGIIREMYKFKGTAEEYFISEVTEEMLLDLGFEYKGYTNYNVSPYYEKENILAYFDDVVLHVMEMTYSAIDKVNKDEEDKKDIRPKPEGPPDISQI